MLFKLFINLILVLMLNLFFSFPSLAVELPLNCTDSTCTFSYFFNNRCRELIFNLDTNQFTRNNLLPSPDFDSCDFSLNQIFFDSQSSETQLTLSLDLARLFAHLLYSITFHGVGISLILLSGGSLWFRRR